LEIDCSFFLIFKILLFFFFISIFFFFLIKYFILFFYLFLFSIGIELVRIATEQDRQGQYESALKNYVAALEALVESVKQETDPKVKDMVTSKILQYMTRSEQIKKILSDANEASSVNKSKNLNSSLANSNVSATLQASLVHSGDFPATPISPVISKISSPQPDMTIPVPVFVPPSPDFGESTALITPTKKIDETATLQSKQPTTFPTVPMPQFQIPPTKTSQTQTQTKPRTLLQNSTNLSQSTLNAQNDVVTSLTRKADDLQKALVSYDEEEKSKLNSMIAKELAERKRALEQRRQKLQERKQTVAKKRFDLEEKKRNLLDPFDS
jgi:hypothetical protein